MVRKACSARNESEIARSELCDVLDYDGIVVTGTMGSLISIRLLRGLVRERPIAFFS